MNLFIIFTIFIVGLLSVSGCASWRAEQKVPMAGSTVLVNDHKIHVLDIGPRESSKPPVVLIHGASANLLDMRMSLGEALSDDRRVLMVDRPGRGYSDRPEDGYQLHLQATYIRDAVTALDVKNPVVVGQSFGGAVALAYALKYQEEMSGLVVLAGVSHEWPGGVAWYNRVSETPVIGFLLRRLIIPVYGQLKADEGIESTFAPDEPPENYFERSGVILLFRPKDFKANASDLVNLKNEIIDQQKRYTELELPVAIITGTADTTVSPEIHSKALARDVSGSSLTLLHGVGHALHHSKTGVIVEAIDQIGSIKTVEKPEAQ